MHGGGSELKGVVLDLEVGETVPTGAWTYHDAYCGIGGISAGAALAGGVCTGAFDRCSRARAVYERRHGLAPHGAWGSFDPRAEWGEAEVLFSAPPCENRSGIRGENEERQMWKQLELVELFKYKVVVVEMLLHFKRMQQGEIFRAFAEELGGRGYAVSCKMLFAPDFASAAARRRVYIVGVRRDVQEECGGYSFPIGRSRHHPVSSILEPEFFRRGVRVRSSSYTQFEVPKQRSKRCSR